ncbi:MAG: Fe-S cluster assembly protein HesB [Methanoregula sp.]|nr:Fe-S cluster assembly protein HesB [Methanoregula sp.]
MSGSSSIKIKSLIRTLNRWSGEIGWWPGNTDEVMIGAILTQQTRWENVDRALGNLKKRGLNSFDAILTADIQDIEDAIRCTGFFRVKAKRLKSLALYVKDAYGSIGGMSDIPTGQLRSGLLNVPGIGEETADSILCYGFFRTSFVIDAYTDRMVRCIGITENRQELKHLFEMNLPKDNHVYRQTHAHIVEYAKKFCAKKRCSDCILVSSNE